MAEAFFYSVECEVLSRRTFTSTGQAHAVVMGWCYGCFYHYQRCTPADGRSPINDENAAAAWAAASQTLHDLGEPREACRPRTECSQ